MRIDLRRVNASVSKQRPHLLQVVLLLEHNAEGAFGVVLNRPSDVEVAAALPGWERLAAPPDVVFVGGPVQQDGVVALGVTGDDRELTKSVLPTVGVVDLEQDPVLATVDLQRIRLFAGYAGWSPGQLETEIASGPNRSERGGRDDRRRTCPRALRPGRGRYGDRRLHHVAVDDRAVDRQRVHLPAHGFDGDLIRLVTIALPHGLGAGDGRLLDDAEEFEREIGRGIHGQSIQRRLRTAVLSRP